MGIRKMIDKSILGEAKALAHLYADRDDCTWYVTYYSDYSNQNYKISAEYENRPSYHTPCYKAKPNKKAMISFTQEERAVLRDIMSEGSDGLVSYTESGDIERSIARKIGMDV